MQKIVVNAYDSRHPDHDVMVNLECDKGVDIALLPGFEVTILVPESPNTRRAGHPEPD